jgi:hypothetical protein
VVSFPQVSLPKSCMHLSPPSYVPHALSISLTDKLPELNFSGSFGVVFCTRFKWNNKNTFVGCETM